MSTSNNKSRIALLSNVNLDMLGMKLRKKYEVVLPAGYGTYMQELLSEKSEIYKEETRAIFLILHGESLFDPFQEEEQQVAGLDQLLAMLSTIVRSHPEQTFFISNLDIPCERIQAVASPRVERHLEYHWFTGVEQLSGSYENCFVFDLKDLVERTGRETFYSRKMWYMGSMPFSKEGMGGIETRIHQLMSALQNEGRKAIAVDLDQTLWGGVIGEDGVDSIVLSEVKEGSRYYDLQCRLRQMKELGILLNILSKNNYEDVFPAVEAHEGMMLRENDFIVRMLDWNEKPDNLVKMAKQLNLGRDAFAFLDDNPVEREKMNQLCPEVFVVPFPTDTSKLSKVVTDLYWDQFLKLRLTNEDLKKTNMYQQEYQRKQEQELLMNQQSFSLADYLKSLQMEVKLEQMKEEQLGRVVQLIGKTNQFNLTTKRYGLSDVSRFYQSPDYYVLTCSVKDKFGDMGLVGVIILHNLEQTAYIDTFLMSCRVMGRRIEQQMLQEVQSICKKNQLHQIYGCYRKTAKNQPVKEIYEQFGFSFVEESEWLYSAFDVNMEEEVSFYHCLVSE